MKLSFVLSCLLLAGCAVEKPVSVAVNPTPRATFQAVSSVQPTAKPKVKAAPRLPQAHVRAIEFSPDARFLAVGTLQKSFMPTIDGEVTVRDCATNRIVKSWEISEGVKCLAFSPDEKRLAVTGANGKLTVWDWKNGRLLHSQILDVEKSTHDHISVAFSPDGRFLALGLEDTGWLNTKTWKSRRAIAFAPRFGVGSVGDVSFSPDGRFLLYVDTFEGYNGLSFIPLKGGKSRQITDFMARSKPVFSRDGRWLAVSDSDDSDGSPVWETKTLKVRQKLASQAFQPQSFSPDARQIAGLDVPDHRTDADQGTVEIWSVKSGKRIRKFKESARRVLWMDAKTLLIGDENGVRRLKISSN